MSSVQLNDLSDDIRDYSFDLPESLIAQSPLERREDARLLLVRRSAKAGEPRFEDLKVSDLSSLVCSLPELQQSLWIRNRTKVIPARFYATRQSGSLHEIVVTEEIEPGLWRAIVRNVAVFKFPQTLYLKAKPDLEFLSPEAGVVDLRPALSAANFKSSVEFLEKFGEMPLPPYIKNRSPSRDVERYQSQWAQNDKAKSVAAPTASLHFSEELCRELESSGVRFADLVLHVGLGTFEPLRQIFLSEHRLHSEPFEILNSEMQKINSHPGKRVCVGTTALRCVESLLRPEEFPVRNTGEWLEARTNLFVRPGFEFKVTDALLTNFHLPQSTLFVLVATFCQSLALAKEAYEHAVKKGYRFFSYGDASLWI